VAVNVAVVVWSVAMVTVHTPVPEHPAPDHPENVEPDAGVATRSTTVFSPNIAEQVEPQLIPGLTLVTIPLPEPVLVTDSVRLSS
jgi:hypothetical protein